jgi:hypothetical protein
VFYKTGLVAAEVRSVDQSSIALGPMVSSGVRWRGRREQNRSKIGDFRD